MITQDRLLSVFDYSEEHKNLIWKIDIRRAKAGTVAGRVTEFGYRQIKLDREYNYAHRLVWLYFTGSMPNVQIDHINHDRDDNRFQNLREATPMQNMANRQIRTRSQHGLQGIVFRPRHKSRPWEANLKINSKTIYLGHFITKEDAHQAYVDAVTKHHEEMFPNRASAPGAS